MKKKLKIFLGFGLALLVIIALYLTLQYIDANGGLMDDSEEDYDDEEETSNIMIGDHEYMLSHDVKTYLFMGTDGSGNENAFGEEYQGSMADFLLLMVIDEEAKQYGFIQLNRDTITDVTLLQKDDSGYASADIQLCTAHWYGKDKKASCENTVNAVSGLLGGIPVDGYYALPMEQIPMLNAAVNGVTVTLEDDFTEVDPTMEKGKTLTLTDEQAYQFVRARMGVGDGENTSRMRRQKVYLNAFLEKAAQENAKSEKFIIKLYDSLQKYATADINMKKVTKLSKQINGFESKGLLVPEGEVKLGKALNDGKEHTEFYIDSSSLEEILKTLYPLVLNDNIDREDTEE